MQDKVLIRMLGLVSVVHLFFAIWPQFDIAVARIFFVSSGEFMLTDHVGAEILRKILWFGSLVCAIVAAVLLGITCVLGDKAQSPWRLWGFVTALYITGPVLLVNSVMKTYWGRARPVSIEEFGGTKLFTPPFEMASQCSFNCSFVSGEAAAAAVLTILLGLCIAGSQRTWRRNVLWLAFASVFVAAATLRVATGRHFVSDVVFAGLFMAILARVHFRMFAICTLCGWPLWASMRADVAAVTQIAVARGRVWFGNIEKVGNEVVPPFPPDAELMPTEPKRAA